MMKFRFKLSAALLSCLLFASCSYIDPKLKDRINAADRVAKHNGFERSLVKGGEFWLTTYQKITDKTQPYVFYIEGDGFAFYQRGRVSDDPTPKNPMMLRLAVSDNRPNIVYIARPCQYTDPERNPLCRKSQSYWLSLRLSENAVESVNRVINALNNDKKFSLIGYSSGGGIAVLVAARNKSVKDIITIAGNLDIKKFAEENRAAELIGSLNPIDYAKKINHIPQIHFSGGKDHTITPFIADEYIKASNSICVHQQVLQDNSHNKGWENSWKYVLSQPLICHRN